MNTAQQYILAVTAHPVDAEKFPEHIRNFLKSVAYSVSYCMAEINHPAIENEQHNRINFAHTKVRTIISELDDDECKLSMQAEAKLITVSANGMPIISIEEIKL